ncbi:MAG TPA: hypothetical protein VER03_16225 [Bryobacteraceae bacterium]|nr:hypothetical protein [Bryobacteraceae bacterium]
MRLLPALCWLTATLGVCVSAPGPKFYPDDPLVREPPPIRVEDARARKISDVYDLFSHVLATPGEKQSAVKRIPAGDVNTLGEVLEGAWYQMRHYRSRMSLAELAAAPGAGKPPSTTGSWTVVSAKSEGITPGFVIEDDAKRRYFLKFDPPRSPELATAADVISSKFFYALGYHVPENFIVHFERARLKVSDRAKFRDTRGEVRKLTSKDVSEIMLKAPQAGDGAYRATASLFLPGKILNEYRYYGTRADDPNDIVSHEHRRSLRGLHVFCAWLDHDDSRSINTLDSLVEENGQKFVKHYLLDFGSTLGSASSGPNSPRSGFEPFFTWTSSAKEFFSLGLFVPAWARIRYPEQPAIGRFSAEQFEPRTWTPEYPNPAFRNRLPEDEFWAARQVMHFTDDEIRAIVASGQYSRREDADYMTSVLIRRRDAIGKAYLSKPLQLDRFRVENGEVRFEDLAVKHGFSPARRYSYAWSEYNNATGDLRPIAGSTDARVPATSAPYLAMAITHGNESPKLTIYLRQVSGRFSLVGIDRASN